MAKIIQPTKPHLVKLSASEQKKLEAKLENKRKLDERIRILEMYRPGRDSNCIPKPETLEPLDRYDAKFLDLPYFFSLQPCKKGHVDVTIFSHKRPFYASGDHICRTCLEEKIAQKLPWRTRSHWSTEPVDKSITPYRSYYKTREHYYNVNGDVPLPSTVEFIGHEEALDLDLVYYLPFYPCPRGHMDFRSTIDHICYSCRLEEVAIRQGKTFKPHKRLGRVGPLKHTIRYEVKHKPMYFDLSGLSEVEMVEYKAKIQMERSARTLFIRRQVSELLYYTITRRSFPIHLQSDVEFTSEELRACIESKFVEGMTWSNWGTGWVLDHIVPVKFFADNDLLVAQIVNNIKNFQPLTPKVNNTKRTYMLREDAVSIRESVLLPNGLDFKEGWDSDYRLRDIAHWYE